MRLQAPSNDLKQNLTGMRNESDGSVIFTQLCLSFLVLLLIIIIITHIYINQRPNSYRLQNRKRYTNMQITEALGLDNYDSSPEKALTKSSVLRRFLKSDKVLAERVSNDKLFQTLGAAIENALSTMASE